MVSPPKIRVSNSPLRTQGWVLSIDQASNSAGISLWKDGVLTACKTLRSVAATDNISTRLVEINQQLNQFLHAQLPVGTKITKVLFEGVRARLVLISVGAFLISPYIDAKLNERNNFIESSSWKRWAKLKGATGDAKTIKGIATLSEVGFDTQGLDSDDVADSIMIYLTWADRI